VSVKKYEKILGDLNGDDNVDIFDSLIMSTLFGSKFGDARWNSLADIKKDNIVDIYDAIMLAQNFGKKMN
jgi:hypothetical protein